MTIRKYAIEHEPMEESNPKRTRLASSLKENTTSENLENVNTSETSPYLQESLRLVSPAPNHSRADRPNPPNTNTSSFTPFTTLLLTTLPSSLRHRIYDLLISPTLDLRPGDPLPHFFRPASVGLPFALEIAQRWYNQKEFYCPSMEALDQELSTDIFALGLDPRSLVRRVGFNLDLCALDSGVWIQQLSSYIRIKEMGILTSNSNIRVRCTIWLGGSREEMYLQFLDSRATVLDCVDGVRDRGGGDMVPDVRVEYYEGKMGGEYRVGKGFEDVGELREWGMVFPLRRGDTDEYEDDDESCSGWGSDAEVGDVQAMLNYDEEAHMMSEVDEDEEGSKDSGVGAYFGGRDE